MCVCSKKTCLLRQQTTIKDLHAAWGWCYVINNCVVLLWPAMNSEQMKQSDIGLGLRTVLLAMGMNRLNLSVDCEERKT